MIFTALLVIFFTIIIYAYLKARKLQNYWQEKGVPTSPSVPFLGHVASAVLGRESFFENGQKFYDLFSNVRYYGLIQFGTPFLVIRDPELIKSILVKDFDHFSDHRDLVSKDVDPIFGRTLLALQGQQWKDMRSIVSPAFTCSKMRIMFSLITEACQQFNDYFLKQEDDVIEIEAKDILSRFTNDSIATIVFGLKCDSLENRNNEFFTMGKKATNFEGLKTLRFFLINIISVKLLKALNLRWIDEDCANYFSDILLKAMKVREEQGIIRPDMIHMLMEAKKGRLRYEDSKNDKVLDESFSAVDESEIGKTLRRERPELCDEDIVAHAFIFFLAGFDTSSTILSLLAYELAINPEIQNRLQKEIDSTLEKCDKNMITYEALQSMKYLDMVVSETLRKWPSLIATDRMCLKEYTIEPVKPEEKLVHLKKGDIIAIPIHMMHKNPQYYPDPEKFDPERFNEENKKNIHPFTYIPFGNGPRACIGSRFALMQIKTVFTYLLSKFTIIKIEKTEVPLKMSKRHFFFTAQNGIWIGLKKR